MPGGFCLDGLAACHRRFAIHRNVMRVVPHILQVPAEDHYQRSEVINICCIPCGFATRMRDSGFFPKDMGTPTMPICGVLGGATIADSIQLIMNLVHLISFMVIGSGVAFTLCKEAGVVIGSSFCGEEGVGLVPVIKQKASEKGLATRTFRSRREWTGGPACL